MHRQALSDAHAFIFEERERLLQLQAENDAFKLQEIEDRKKIQHLLSIANPSEQEITYNQGKRPDVAILLPPDTQKTSGEPCAKRNEPERIMRTVYLPTANADTLLLKVESLQAQLNEQVGSAHDCCRFQLILTSCINTGSFIHATPRDVDTFKEVANNWFKECFCFWLFYDLR